MGDNYNNVQFDLRIDRLIDGIVGQEHTLVFKIFQYNDRDSIMNQWGKDIIQYMLGKKSKVRP